MDSEDRPSNFLSKKYDSLRKVPGYSNFIQEKFERCLDLYLCPRQRKVRVSLYGRLVLLLILLAISKLTKARDNYCIIGRTALKVAWKSFLLKWRVGCLSC